MPMGSRPEEVPKLDRAGVEEAHRLITPYIHRTPVLTSRTLSDIASTPQAAEALVGTEDEGEGRRSPRSTCSSSARTSRGSALSRREGLPRAGEVDRRRVAEGRGHAQLR